MTSSQCLASSAGKTVAFPSSESLSRPLRTLAQNHGFLWAKPGANRIRTSTRKLSVWRVHAQGSEIGSSSGSVKYPTDLIANILESRGVAPNEGIGAALEIAEVLEKSGLEVSRKKPGGIQQGGFATERGFAYPGSEKYPTALCQGPEKSCERIWIEHSHAVRLVQPQELIRFLTEETVGDDPETLARGCLETQLDAIANYGARCLNPYFIADYLKSGGFSPDGAISAALEIAEVLERSGL